VATEAAPWRLDGVDSGGLASVPEPQETRGAYRDAAGILKTPVRRSTAMRIRSPLLASLLASLLVALLALAPALAQSESMPAWTTWLDDPAGDAGLADGVPAPDSRADLTTFSVRITEEFLYMRLQTVGGVDADEGWLVQTQAEFDVQAATGHGKEESYVRVIGDNSGVRVSSLELRQEDWGVRVGSTAWSYEAWVRIAAVVAPSPEIVLTGLVVRANGAATWDEGQAQTALRFQRAEGSGYIAQAIPTPATWVETEGPDLGGGPSVAYDSAGRIHVAYYVYEGDRGTAVGVYHAVLKPYAAGALDPALGSEDGLEWNATRIGDFRPSPDDNRDEDMRTKIAVAGETVHVLYSPCPGRACATPYVYATSANGFESENPAAGLKVRNAPRDVPGLAATGSRVIAAIPLADGGIALRQRAEAGWTTVATLANATVPKMAIDWAGRLHVAFVRTAAESFASRDLMYAVEPALSPQRILSGVTAPGEGAWDTPEVDGSFGFALNREGAACFAWDGANAPQPRRGYGCLANGIVVGEDAPFQPGHGNTQLAMRLGFDGAGNAHVVSGYGSMDLHAKRTPGGVWTVEDLDAGDMWDMAVASDGSIAVAYTQPHGGTTVAVSELAATPELAIGFETTPPPPGGEIGIPGPGAGLVVVVLAALAGLARRQVPPRAG